MYISLPLLLKYLLNPYTIGPNNPIKKKIIDEAIITNRIQSIEAIGVSNIPKNLRLRPNLGVIQIAVNVFIMFGIYQYTDIDVKLNVPTSIYGKKKIRPCKRKINGEKNIKRKQSNRHDSITIL